MSTDHRKVLVISIVGFLILIAGSLGYMGVYSLDSTISYILMGIGIVAVVAGMAVMCLTKDTANKTPEEE